GVQTCALPICPFYQETWPFFQEAWRGGGPLVEDEVKIIGLPAGRFELDLPVIFPLTKGPGLRLFRVEIQVADGKTSFVGPGPAGRFPTHRAFDVVFFIYSPVADLYNQVNQSLPARRPVGADTDFPAPEIRVKNRGFYCTSRLYLRVVGGQLEDNLMPVALLRGASPAQP